MVETVDEDKEVDNAVNRIYTNKEIENTTRYEPKSRGNGTKIIPEP